MDNVCVLNGERLIGVNEGWLIVKFRRGEGVKFVCFFG